MDATPRLAQRAKVVIGTLRTAGFPVDLAARAFLTLDSYIYGFVVQETSFSVAVGITDRAGDEPSPIEYPRLAEMVGAATRPGNDYADAFDFGLDLILDALGCQLVSGSGSPYRG